MSAPICIYHWQKEPEGAATTVTTLLHANISDVTPTLAVKHMCHVVLVPQDSSSSSSCSCSEIKNKLATDIYKGQQEIEAGEFNAS